MTTSVRIRSLVLLGTLVVVSTAHSVSDTGRSARGTDQTVPTVETSTQDAEKRPFIGIELGSATEGGTAVADIIAGTAAERFGLRAGDVILRIDETPTGSPRRVGEALAARRPGEVIEIELIRSGERQTIRLELGVRPTDLELRRDRADHVLEVLQLRPGLDVADIGCGSGWLSEAIAIELEGNGTVYAVEVQESRIETLRRRALPGIVPVLSEPGDISLPEESLDIAMLHDVASHVAEDARKSFYESVARALRPDGRLVVFGPHGDAETILEVLRDNAFVPVDEGAFVGLAPEDLDQRLNDGIVFRHASK